MWGMMTPQPITGYLGVNGSGKTLTAVAFALRDQRRTGRTLLTNVGGLSADHEYFDDVEDLPGLMAKVGTCNIVLDEVGSMFSSRESGRNKAFQRACQQLRKYHARMLWTAPTFARAEKIAREVTFMAILCQPIIKQRVPGDPWPSTRLILQKGFNVARLDASAQKMHSDAKTMGYGIVRTKRWQDSFDTFASVAGSALPGEAGLRIAQ